MFLVCRNAIVSMYQYYMLQNCFFQWIFLWISWDCLCKDYIFWSLFLAFHLGSSVLTRNFTVVFPRRHKSKQLYRVPGFEDETIGHSGCCRIMINIYLQYESVHDNSLFVQMLHDKLPLHFLKCFCDTYQDNFIMFFINVVCILS